MKRYLFILIFAFMGCKTADDLNTSSKITKIPHEDLKIEKTFKSKSIGQSFGIFDASKKQMVHYDILVHSYTSPNDRRHLVIVGGVHGGYEWNSVALADDILQIAKQNPTIIPDDVSLHIITCLNVDGYVKIFSTPERVDDAIGNQKIALGENIDHGRFNGRSVDLNRNFFYYGTKEPTGKWQGKTVNAGAFHFSEPETRALRDFVKSLPIDSAKVELVFLHSAVTGGAVIPPQVKWWNGVSPKQFPDSRSEELAAIYEKRTNFRNSNNVFGLTSSTTGGAYIVKGDAAIYFARDLSLPSITIELPVKNYPIDSESGINHIKNDNIEAIKALLWDNRENEVDIEESEAVEQNTEN